MLFRGATYTIPEKHAFDVACQIEDIALLHEIVTWNAAPNYTKMSKCIGAMLRYAGCKVADREVHREIMSSLMDDRALIAGCLTALLEVLFDGAPKGDGTSSGKPDAS